MDGYNMTTLMKRLEAATSRLEDLVATRNIPVHPLDASATAAAVASAVSSSAIAAGGQRPSTGLSEPAAAPSADATSLGPSTGLKEPATAAATAAASPANPGVTELEALASTQLAEFVKLSDSIDPLVAKQAAEFATAAKAMTSAVAIAAKSAKPDPTDPAIGELFGPLNKAGQEVVAVREYNRGAKEVANHLATVAEAVPALGWLGVDAPADFVQEFRDSAQFYGNRVLRENKAHAAWVKALSEYLGSVKAVIAKHFKEGPWAANGLLLAEAIKSSANSSSTGSSTGPVPPPPPPPPSVAQLTAGLDEQKEAKEAKEAKETATNKMGGGLAGVFSELSKGESITAGLKHVDRKHAKANLPPKPSLKPRPSTGSGTKPKDAAAVAASAKSPVKELVDRRWIVEYFVDDANIEVDVSISESVLIDNCHNCTVVIKGKPATISISQCTKIGVAADTVVASLEVVKCKDYTIQATGRLPSVNLDQSHNGHLYLGENALETEIYASQSTSTNVNLPGGEPGDWKEVPLPEQIVHTFSDGKLVSKALVHG